MTDLTTLSLPQLLELQDEIADQIVQARREQLVAVQASIQKLIEESGLSRAEVLGPLLKPQKPTRAVGAAVVIPAAHYRHPEKPSLSWLGKGKRPAWLVELVEAGHSLDELRVK